MVVNDLAKATYNLDAMCLLKACNAGAKLLNNGILVFGNSCKIEANFTGGHTAVSCIAGILKHFRTVKQGLCRNTATVEASAAKLTGFYQSGLFAKLRTSNSAFIPTRTCTKHYNIIIKITHKTEPFHGNCRNTA